MKAETKHTRDGWHTSGKALSVIDGNGQLVCVLAQGRTGDRELIAAAPELLVACQASR